MNKLKTALALAFLLIFMTGAIGYTSSPPLPASFYGTVKLDGINAAEGTIVSAWINGVKLAETTTTLADGQSVYLFDVPGDDPDTPAIEGGREGEIVVFEVAGYDVDQTSRWFNSTHHRLDLTATTGPDLVVTAINLNAVTTDPQTLIAGGTGKATIRNQGKEDVPADTTFAVTFFEDRDGNGAYDPAMDNTLGEATYTGGLAYGAEVEVQALVTGEMRFRDNLIYAFVDSKNVVRERNELNNLNHSGNRCEFWPPIGQFNPVLEWEWTGGTLFPGFAEVDMTPVVIDLTADGIPDVVFITYDHRTPAEEKYLVALNGKDGSEIFTVRDPAHLTGANFLTTRDIAVGDIDLDGRPEILAVSVGGGWTSGSVLAFEHDGAFKWRTGYLGFTPGSVTLADLDRDGVPEIIVGGTAAINNDGTIRWINTLAPYGGYGGAIGSVLVANLDLEGDPEVVAGNAAFRSDGSVYWHWNDRDNDIHFDGFNAIANLDDDPFPEVVLFTNESARDQGLYVFEHDGTLKWGPVATGPDRPGNESPPAIADVDGDGEPEIVVVQADLFWTSVFEADGSCKWNFKHSPYHGQPPSVFDFDGDGAAEIVHFDNRYLYILRGADGAVLWQTPHVGSLVIGGAYPAIADVDADGNAEIIVPGGFYPGLSPTPGIRVYGDANDTWAPTRQIWNQHSYHINNINDDGTIPAEETNSWEDHNTYRSNRQYNLHRAPDLSASRLFFDTTGLPDTLRITARIGNGGSLQVGEVPVGFYDGNPVTGGTLLGTVKTTKILKLGEYEDVTFTWSLPAAGTHDIYVVADDDGTDAGTQNECDETNNTHHQTVDTGIIGPDLVAPVVDAGGAQTDLQALTIAGDVTVQIKNQGNRGVTEPFQVTLFEDTDQDGIFTEGADNVLGQRTYFGRLAAGQSVWLPIAVSGNVLFRDNLIYAFVDSQDVIAELDEDNNYNQTGASCQALPAGGAPLAAPDLTAFYLRVDVNAYPAAVTFTARIGNGGATNVPAGLLVAFYDGDPGAGGTRLGVVQTTQALAPGEYEDVTFVWAAPGAGLQTVYVVADDDGAGAGTQNECDEANNVHWREYITGPEGPDLTIPLLDGSGASIDPRTLALCGTISAQIANQGSTAATGDFDVTFFEDVNGDSAYTPGSDNVLGQTTISGGLPPGATVSAEAAVSGTVRFVGSAIWAFADSGDAIPELDESNNLDNTASQCRVAGQSAPDVTVSHLTGEPAPPILTANAASQNPPALWVDLTARVANAGEAALNAGVPVTFYRGDPNAGGALIGSTATGQALAPGAYEDVTVRWTDAYSDTHPIYITVGETNDCDASNNSYQQTIDILDIPLDESWNLISGWVNPHNNDIIVVQRPITDTYVVIMGFDQGAASYYPDLPPRLNTLQDFDAEHGYWVKVKPLEASARFDAQDNPAGEVTTLRLVGSAFAENRELALDANWNLTSFLPRHAMGIAEGLRSIDGQYTAVLGFDHGALSYYPSLPAGLNTLARLEPLHGYWIRMNQEATLRYPLTQPPVVSAAARAEDDPGAARRARLARQAEQATGVQPTNTWVNFWGPALYDNGEPVPEGSLVQVYDAAGVPCGAGIVTASGQYGLLACYGDDPTTPEDEGARPGDVLSFSFDGQPATASAKAVWTAHGDLQRVLLQAARPKRLWLPLVVETNTSWRK